MKNVALIVLSITTMVFASLYFHESSKVTETQNATAALRQRVVELQSTVDDQEQKSASLHSEVKLAHLETAARDKQIERLSAASISPAQAAIAAARAANQTPSKPSNPLSGLAKMFEDPQMREALAAQQKATLGPMIEKTYGKLFTDLALTPEQATALKEKLLNKQMSAAEMGMSLISGDSDQSKTAELAQKIKSSSDAADAEIKSFLGDDKFAQLQSYEKTMPDRMAISGFKDQLNGSVALTPDQEQRMIDAMTQERQNFKFTTDLADKSKVTGDFSAMFNEETVNKFMEETDLLNQRVLGQAQNILTPDQLAAFQKYQNTQQALQKIGMQMGAKMLAPAK